MANGKPWMDSVRKTRTPFVSFFLELSLRYPKFPECGNANPGYDHACCKQDENCRLGPFHQGQKRKKNRNERKNNQEKTRRTK
ncbi:MAG: hypothetical protein IT174_02440 [Acidobacteria bacterium]|nr:hypothetical protein [Acidobacteriota bacterium]